MVHQFKNNGYDIVLDVNSGAIHVVDDVTYDVIALFEDHPGKRSLPSYNPGIRNRRLQKQSKKQSS